ncbi:L-aspartate oxidase [Liquorilactobacillus uvarum]|uniref:L-aspartate oxidase n=1 Tax=Liquorilactobacillus uvarum DSM 19971 TaxID=1423812 RepID=A0A0R1Q6U2_9LACO|nr:L-aspartate oxidase [Liquorilactobacillus uvarum]KRL37922.1 L-aspartate oxidase [Liquorilactobacillus uvarum DSM 19971]
MKKVIIVGAGLAGSYIATLFPSDYDITIITKKTRLDSNSMLAQGGVAAALDKGDSPQEHEKDTLKAGNYHNDKQAVKQLVNLGPKLIDNLISQGMNFDRSSDGQLAFGLEGAHSFHRILHAQGDQTGHELTKFVQSIIRNDIKWEENTTVLDLVIEKGECKGVVTKNKNGKVTVKYADFTVLASGGLGHLYPLTTNDQTITGDGIALAFRNNVELKDMAYVQFHPTLLTKKGKCYGLITEAIRGAGAILIDENGNKIMQNTPQKDLAPRDVVTRKLKAWQQKGHKLFLDISHIQSFKQKFPGVTRNLINHQIDFETTKKIPIQPGAHFFMGGIKTNLEAQTSIRRLYAIGEVACNGVHGANRLASNSLLDCLVSADKAAQSIMQAPSNNNKNFVQYDDLTYKSNIEPVLPSKDELLEKTWKQIGVVRSKNNLNIFLKWLDKFNYKELSPEKISSENLTITNLCICAELIAKSALAQPKSLGANYIKGV